MPTAAELDTTLGLLIVMCELALLLFLFCIGRFYELKFSDRTYYAGFLVPLLVFAAAAIVFPVAGISLQFAELAANLSVLAVALTLGVFLFLRMTGAAR
jgi:uncharacterized membrane protein